MRQLKIAVIGGGSSYTPELVSGLVHRFRDGEFHCQELALVDIDPGKERLETVASFTRRLLQKQGVPCHIEATLNRRDALDGASFVISQIRIGGMAARQTDELIPLKYGVIGQETTGPGGFANALRTIPASLDIARDISEVSPDAWLLNFSNPSGLVTEALLHNAGIKTFGLCNVPIGIKMGAARAMGVEPSRIRIDISGLNHLSFVTAVYLDGANVTDRVLDSPLLEAYAAGTKMSPDLVPFMRKLRVIPASYLYYYWCTDRALADQKSALESGTGTRAAEVMAIEKDLFRIYSNPQSDEIPPELMKRGGAYYSDVALNCVSSIVNDRPSVEALNVQNRGAVPGLEGHAVVEVSCMVDARGPHPMAQERLPQEILGLVQQVKAYETLTVEAAVSGDSHKAFWALVNHPLVPGAETALALFRDILETNSEFLRLFQGNRL